MIELREEPVSDLREYASVPSVFESLSAYDVRRTSGGVQLVERPLGAVFRKDYDRFEDPLAWSRELEKADAVFVSAYVHARRAGGVIIAVDSPGLLAWSRDRDVAVLWDLRVAPAYRRQGVATILFHAAQASARRRACTEINVETQNTNVAACKFYTCIGFVLRQAKNDAYPHLPDEVQLIWSKSLEGSGTPVKTRP